MLQVNKTPLNYSKKVSCELECYGLRESEVTRDIRQGEVIFKKSKTKTMPRVYWIENNGMSCELEMGDTTVFIVTAFHPVDLKYQDCNCPN